MAKGGRAGTRPARRAPAAGAERKTPAAAAAEEKSIVLFSDGTGNSSAKLFKTNVWRMYEAVDLGPSPSGKRDQISFYDDGVGTSGFKPLAALGGAFGWGLKRNVLDIYRYACRNYRPGDHIYGFGFSRGAFTMRLVIALIASQGLVPSDDEAELQRRSRCAYRAFRAAFLPRKLKAPTRLFRRVRDGLSRWREARKGYDSYDRSRNYDPVIRFVGVWDTVAAYGGPISEITRAIDNWVYPLSMPDYQLSAKVQRARHALSLDDERDAFQPLLWDEVHEDSLVDSGNVARDRLQQVWFTGMHADVGGGYPDESLSYVSLLWMLEEAEKAGLRTLDVIKDRYFALANSYGPMHDSRSGLGAYYRYQPRKIAAWLDPLDKRYLMLQDPDIEGPGGREQGLLRRVLVHESVIARIDTGTDRYAPIALPERFEVIPPQTEGETVEQATSETEEPLHRPPPSEPLIAPQVRSRLKASEDERFACQENLWDLVWKRRLSYFLTVGATLLLVALPLGNPFPFLEQSCSDGRCVLPNIIRSAKMLVPGFADRWIEAFALYPVTAIALAVAIWWIWRWGQSLEARLGDSSHRLWRSAIDGQVPEPQRCTPSRLRNWRESLGYQQLFRALKWYVLPGLFGLLMMLMILYLPLVALTQASLAVEEVDHHFCAAEAPASLKPFVFARRKFNTRSPCVATGLRVDKGQVYDIVFQLPVTQTGDPAEWYDGRGAGGKPTGIRAAGLAHFLGVPMRRVITARYLQPVAQITVTRRDNPGRLGRWLRGLFPNVDRVDERALDLQQDPEWPELWRVRFKAPESGSLHFFANDSQLPFGGGRSLYDNNCGNARVMITKVLRRTAGQPPQHFPTIPDANFPPPRCTEAHSPPQP
ncbi:MAG: hypothetical protein QOJ94_212 [Sphingomonadales bacterium]|jgi:uncharacterized protein (DUF2235 family)|nr:hypothetical protein [Sphingomonadales bacterium]